MIRFLLVSVTGWVAVLFTGVEVALPYIIRTKVVPDSRAGLPASVPRLRTGMWPHYWLGFALVGLVLVHASFVGPMMGRSDATGTWAATLALCLLFLQVGLGLNLKSGTGPIRQLRQWHFWSMIGLAASVLAHLFRNA